MRGHNRTKVSLGHYPNVALAEASRKAMLLLASTYEPEAPSILFEDAKAEYLSQTCWRPHYHSLLVSTLRHFEWQRPLNKISVNDVASIMNGIRTGPSARAHALASIRSLFNWCITPLPSVVPL